MRLEQQQLIQSAIAHMQCMTQHVVLCCLPTLAIGGTYAWGLTTTLQPNKLVVSRRIAYAELKQVLSEMLQPVPGCKCLLMHHRQLSTAPMM